MTQDEALKLALEALDWEDCNDDDGLDAAKEKAITAIKEALAQPEDPCKGANYSQTSEQEPMTWRNAAIRVGEDLCSVGPFGYYNMTAQQWLDWAMAQQPRGNNSLAQPEQEPVAWLNRDSVDGLWYPNAFKTDNLEPSIPLYTTPPQRKPLTHPQIHEFDWPDGVSFDDILLFVRSIEQAHGIKENT